ncbi:hypothetical protein ACVGV8_12465, partial [Enterobacter intestinihominis]
LQIDYAALLQARGLPRAADQKLKTPQALEPTNLELEKHQAYVAMDLHAGSYTHIRSHETT